MPVTSASHFYYKRQDKEEPPKSDQGKEEEEWGPEDIENPKLSDDELSDKDLPY